MTSTIQEVDGIRRALDRLEVRVVEYRKLLQEIDSGKKTEGDIERIAITTGEVETIESVIERVARRITAGATLS
jgi:hypothetical protein